MVVEAKLIDPVCGREDDAAKADRLIELLLPIALIVLAVIFGPARTQ